MEFSDAVARRYSCRSFDPLAVLDDETLAELLGEAILSPSSYNLQHWRFVVVREPERKRALREVSWHQVHVESCSAVVAVCANLDAHLHAGDTLGHLPPARREELLPMIQGFYEGDPQLARDEAIRSASFAAMTLMHAAADRGWDSCPLIGFEPDAVAALLEVPEHWVIALLIVIGKGVGEAPPRHRLPLGVVAHHETCSGAPLLEALTEVDVSGHSG